MVEAGEGYGEVLQTGTLAENGCRKRDVGDDRYVGVGHAGSEDGGVFVAVEVVVECVTEGGKLVAEFFKMLTADAERLYAYDVHGVLFFLFDAESEASEFFAKGIVFAVGEGKRARVVKLEGSGGFVDEAVLGIDGHDVGDEHVVGAEGTYLGDAALDVEWALLFKLLSR
jgi:hypothetical protein